MFVCFFLFFLFSNHASLTQTLSTPSNSLSQTLTSLFHRRRPNSILNITDPPVDPLHRTPKPTQTPSCRSMPQTHASNPPPIHASDPSRLSLMLSTLSNSHFSVPPPSIHTIDLTRLQVSCLCLLHLHAWDFLFG